MELSKHFTLEEGKFSSTALRMGINNTPTDEIIERMKVAAECMEKVRKALGNIPIHVDSWYRCEALERVITAKDYVRWCNQHGHPLMSSWNLYFRRKAHPKGYAVDFVCPEFGTPLEIVKALVKAKIKFDQLIQEGTWVHISFDPMMRGEVMTATFAGDGTPHYSNGI